MVTFVLPGPAASPDPLGSWVVDEKIRHNLPPEH